MWSEEVFDSVPPPAPAQINEPFRARTGGNLSMGEVSFLYSRELCRSDSNVGGEVGRLGSVEASISSSPLFFFFFSKIASVNLRSVD